MYLLYVHVSIKAYYLTDTTLRISTGKKVNIGTPLIL